MRTALLITIIFLVGCSNNPPKDVNIPYGKFSDSIYHNKYFGFTMNIPVNWIVKDAKTLKETGEDDYSSSLKNKIEDYDEKETHYTFLFKLEKDTTLDSLFSSISFIVEPISQLKANGISTVTDYFKYTEKIVTSHNTNEYPKFEFSKIKETRTLGTRSVMTQGWFKWENQEHKSNSIVYGIIWNEYLLLVRISDFVWKEELKEAKTVLENIRWT